LQSLTAKVALKRDSSIAKAAQPDKATQRLD
jgi:hypothetical protein